MKAGGCGKENNSIIQIANIEFGGEGPNEVNLERKIIIFVPIVAYLLFKI